jgi:geranylgeranyl pyrophosphate synthase
LCCKAAGGKLEATQEVSAAWLLLYTSAHLVDAVEDGDPDPKIDLLGGSGAAINTANGLFLSAARMLNSLQEKDLPEGLGAGIAEDYLRTILTMMGGQHLDLSLPRVDVDRWWQIAEAKTGSFFSLACRAGAQFGTRDQQKLTAYSDFGFHLGLMLQVIDDLEEFYRLLEAGENGDPLMMRNSLAVAYAENVLPDQESKALTLLIQDAPSLESSTDDLIEILDECGAGLYMAAELAKHFDLAAAALNKAQPESAAGEKLNTLLQSLKVS